MIIAYNNIIIMITYHSSYTNDSCTINVLEV